MKKLFLIYFSLIVLVTGVFGGCSNKTNYIHHINDSVRLSLYNVYLGDSLSVVKTKFRYLSFVPLDSLSTYVPIEDNMKVVYKDLGVSIFTTDTIFVADHTGWQHWANNAPKEFPVKNTKHRAQLIFFIKDYKVIQSEIIIYSYIIDDYKGIDFSGGDFIESIKYLYNKKYNNPDSILVYNRYSKKSATYSIDTDSVAKVDINDYIGATDRRYGNNISFVSIWSWKNANIIAEWDFQPFKGESYWSWCSCNMARIIYTDLNAVELESKKRQILIRLQEQDSIRKIKKIENENENLLREQVI